MSQRTAKRSLNNTALAMPEHKMLDVVLSAVALTDDCDCSAFVNSESMPAGHTRQLVSMAASASPGPDACRSV